MVFLFPYMARWNSANMSRYGHLFRKLADVGHTVVVTQPPPRSSEETNYIDLTIEGHPNIHVFTVDMPDWMWQTKFPADKFFKKALYTVASVRTLRKLSQEYNPDALVLYNLPQYLYTFFIHRPVIFDYADDYVAMLKHELGVRGPHPLVWLSNAILRRLIARSILVTCVSDVLKDMVNSTQVILLPNGAEEFPQHEEGESIGDQKNRPTIGYVGAFEYFIDITMMLDVAERLKDARFLFVGAGRDLTWTRQEIGRRNLTNVNLTGAVPHDRAMQYVAEMDICLNLFTAGDVSYGASPIKVFEYLAAGRPVVSTPLPALKKLDEDGTLLFYAESADQVITHIHAILADPALRASHVRRGRELLNAEYTWTKLARKFVREIEQRLKPREDSVMRTQTDF